MKLVIATLKELHEINRWGGGGERKRHTKENSKHRNVLDENKYDKQTASILSCKL